MNLGLGRSIYSPAQLEEFSRFQESQGTRRAFLAESAEMAYNSRARGQWGSGLSDLATESLIDAVGYHLVPMYQVIGPTAAVALMVLFLVGILRMLLDIVIKAIAIGRIRGCRWWLMGAFWGTLFQKAVKRATSPSGRSRRSSAGPERSQQLSILPSLTVRRFSCVWANILPT
jgi:hypothetical protein